MSFGHNKKGFPVSNVLQGGDFQENRRATLTRLRVLRQAYQSGVFTEPTTVPMPEIVADGQGPDDWHWGSGDSARFAYGACRREAAFRVATELQGRPFCATCGVLSNSPPGRTCPVCGNS